MRHNKKSLKINRDVDHKQSLRRTLLTQLLLHDKIKTTQKKAEFVISEAEKLLKKVQTYGNQNAIRELNRVLTNEIASRKTLELFKERFKDRTSGFTRITKLGWRKGDGASLVLLELV